MTRLARLLVLLPDAMLSDIDLYRRYAPDMPPRAEAIRRLLARGLDAIKRDDWTLHQNQSAEFQADYGALIERREARARERARVEGEEEGA